jgi:hypothetical protein
MQLMRMIPKRGSLLNHFKLRFPSFIWLNCLMWPAVRFSRQFHPMPMQSAGFINGVFNPNMHLVALTGTQGYP